MKRFKINSEDTGRYFVHSFKTGKIYLVEPIGNGRMADWGSYNPSTGKIENKKGAGKYVGSVRPEDSIITEENGFKNIVNLEVGKNPMDYINRIDEEYYEKMTEEEKMKYKQKYKQ